LAFLFFTDRQLSLPVIGALLTIAGYSLNDTVVVFDRIREEFRLRGRDLNFVQLINLSVNETLSRTLLTSLTTLIAALALYIFGGGVINDFAFVLVIGVLTGTYSSVFIASPILLLWHPSKLAPQEEQKAPAKPGFEREVGA
jgi:preprotein translocase subunit SecF